MTNKCFTREEFKLLNKNLNFCPRPSYFNKQKLNSDLLQFYRRIKLKSFFGNKPRINIENQNQFKTKRKSNWIPSKCHHTVDTFIAAINKELQETNIKKPPTDNLSSKERKALNELKVRDDIIITNADKGGAVVILDSNDYLKEAERQLSDQQSYLKLNEEPTVSHTQKVKETLNELTEKKFLEKKFADMLVPDEIKTPHFYLLPKIHKPGNPGRPVISSVGCHTSEISRFVDFKIQPEVTKLNSYIQDTRDFINKLNEAPVLPKGTFLISLDVRSLYTSIPNDEGLQAVEAFLIDANRHVEIPIITELLKLVLTLNNFSFNNTNYLQIKGCAMGTICAPAYANLFMGKFENDNIYPHIKEFSKLYLRYIDDIFMTWTGSFDSFKNFIDKLNSCHSSIKFDYEISDKEIAFLDTIVYITEDGKLKTKLYTKPTDRQNFLHRKSAHPNSLLRSIPFGQALRIKRICSDLEDYQMGVTTLKSSFLKRGYTEKEIDEQLKKADEMPRENTLSKSVKKDNEKIMFITTYNKTNPDFNKIIKKHWHLLQLDPELGKCFTDEPIFAYRRNKTLKNLIGGNKFNPNHQTNPTKQTGLSAPCTAERKLKCCKHIVETTTFKSNVTNKSYTIRHKANCKSSNVLYLLECTLCRLQYIGKSETYFYLRLNNYRSEVKKDNPSPSAKHFKLPGHNFDEHARFTIIEKIETPESITEKTRYIEQREDSWIRTLRTLTPQGINGSLNHPQLLTGIL